MRNHSLEEAVLQEVFVLFVTYRSIKRTLNGNAKTKYVESRFLECSPKNSIPHRGYDAVCCMYAWTPALRLFKVNGMKL